MFVGGSSCLTGVLFVLFEFTLAEVFRNPRGTGFCHKFSECRLDARKQFERCAGGFMAMVLAKQGTLDKLRNEGAGMRPSCDEIFTTLIDQQVRPYYDQLEEQTFKCAKENTGIAFSLDRTQELVCLAIQDEVMTSKADLDGVGSEDECRQVYESDLRRCEMIKDCCPSYEHCRTKVETESGIHFKERQIAVQFEKCLRDSGFKYKSEAKAHPEKAFKGEPLPGEVRDESDDESDKEDEESEKKRFAPTQPTTSAPVRLTLPTLPPPDKTINDIVKLLFPGLSTTTTTTTLKPTPSTPVLTGITPTSASMHSTVITSSAILQRRQQRLKEREKLRATTVASKRASTVASQQPQSVALNMQKDSNATTRTKAQGTTTLAAKNTLRKKPLANVMAQTAMMNRIFCAQFMECTEVLEEQYDRCDELYQAETFGTSKDIPGGHNSDIFGITNRRIRALFLLNSNVSDKEIKERCLEDVDPTTQRQLLLLRDKIAAQNKFCIQAQAPEQINGTTLKECETVRLLSELSALTKDKDTGEKKPQNLQGCYKRLGSLERKCSSLQSCCPQDSMCETANQSKESEAYAEIIEQLSQEQTLCEKRMLRIRNGLV